MIAIVLVNYNGWRDTAECVDSLLQLDGHDWRIIVVDNGSQDDSVRQLRDWATAKATAFQILDSTDGAITRAGAGITLICSDVNLGFAGGNNLGITHALNDPECSHVWLLNNDTVVEKSAGIALLDRFRSNNQAGIVGSTLAYYHQPDRLQGVGFAYNVYTATGHQLGHMRPVTDLPEQESVEAQMTYVIGASMMVSRAFLETVGLMSERYFLYFEELDWAIRARGKFRLAWAPTSLVFHKEGGSIGTSTTSRPSDVSTYYMARATLLFYRSHYPLLLPVAMLRLALRTAKLAIRRDWSALAAIVRAAYSALRGGEEKKPGTPSL